MPFIYNKYVTERDFVGRKTEVNILSNLLRAGENVVIYEPAKTGKMSLIQQSLIGLKVSGMQFQAAEFSLLNVRSAGEFISRLCSTMLRAVASDPSEMNNLVSEYLSFDCFKFDAEAYEIGRNPLAVVAEPDVVALQAALTFPWKVAERKGERFILIINEFQNIMLTGNSDFLVRKFESAIKGLPDNLRKCLTLILSGSCVNAMKDIFEVHGRFHRIVERVKISPADDKEVIDHVVKGFLSGGKVVEKELLLGVSRFFRGNIWYINHFASICDSLSRGYIMEGVLTEALDRLISIHEPRFVATMNDLTTFQVLLLRAMIEGNIKFSSAEVIKKYGLNSSANVRRIKDALCKKEIITFGENEEPVFLDPLFEYWVRTHYFEIA